MTVSPTQAFSTMKSPLTGSANAETFTIENCPSTPTITIKMKTSLDGGEMVQQGDCGKSGPTSLGNNRWQFKLWPAYWYNASGTGPGIIMQPGYYCQGTVTISAGGQTATVYLRGSIITDGIIP